MIRNASWLWVVAIVGVCASVGCHHGRRTEPVAIGILGRPVTLAVAPAHDLSGTGRLDPLAFTDIFAHELAQVSQVQVVPVNQALAVMYGQGWRRLESPQQAMQLARLTGADGVVVLAVTEFDPYDPPRLGLIAEVYLLETAPGNWPGEQVNRSPAPVTSRPAVAAAPARQMQRVFEAARTREQERIRQYAARRDPPGKHDWQEYMRSQQQFLRYCSWQTALELAGAAGGAMDP